MTPRPGGQLDALRLAYQDAGFSPATVGYVEAHGTATTVGDVVEVGALRKLFEEAGWTPRDGARTALGSVKANIGHTMSASGIAGLIKAALALHHRKLPPQPGVSEENPRLELGTGPFFLPRSEMAWEANGASTARRRELVRLRRHQRAPRAGGGAGAPREGSRPAAAAQGAGGAVLPRQLARASVVAKFARQLADALPLLQREGRTLPDVAFTLSQRAHGDARLAVVADSFETLSEKLSACASALEKRGDGASDRMAPAAPSAPVQLVPGAVFAQGPFAERKVALLFPGQGAQRVGLLREAYEQLPVFREELDRLDDSIAGPARAARRIAAQLPLRAALAGRRTAPDRDRGLPAGDGGGGPRAARAARQARRARRRGARAQPGRLRRGGCGRCHLSRGLRAAGRAARPRHDGARIAGSRRHGQRRRGPGHGGGRGPRRRGSGRRQPEPSAADGDLRHQRRRPRRFREACRAGRAGDAARGVARVPLAAHGRSGGNHGEAGFRAGDPPRQHGGGERHHRQAARGRRARGLGAPRHGAGGLRGGAAQRLVAARRAGVAAGRRRQRADLLRPGHAAGRRAARQRGALRARRGWPFPARARAGADLVVGHRCRCGGALRRARGGPADVASHAAGYAGVLGRGAAREARRGAPAPPGRAGDADGPLGGAVPRAGGALATASEGPGGAGGRAGAQGSGGARASADGRSCSGPHGARRCAAGCAASKGPRARAGSPRPGYGRARGGRHPRVGGADQRVPGGGDQALADAGVRFSASTRS